MIPHVLRIANRNAAAANVAAGLVATLLAACARPQGGDPAALTADRAWVTSVCDADGPEAGLAKDWPRHALGRISIAVPPEFRRGASAGFSLHFERGTASLHVSVEREAGYGFLGLNRPGQVECSASYGGFPTEAYSWHGTGSYYANAIWKGLNAPDRRQNVRASIVTTRLRDAILLRQALHTIAIVPDSAR